jgi:hypothetical protein
MRLELKSVCAVVLLLTVTVLGGCGTARTTIGAAPEQRTTFQSIQVVDGNSTVLVPLEYQAAFKLSLNEALYKKSGFLQGDELTLKIRWIQFSAGDRFKRWFFGGIGNSGEGSMTIEAVYQDRSGKELAKTTTEGRIGSGFFGGSFDDAIARAAEEIANYAASTFKK